MIQSQQVNDPYGNLDVILKLQNFPEYVKSMRSLQQKNIQSWQRIGLSQQCRLRQLNHMIKDNKRRCKCCRSREGRRVARTSGFASPSPSQYVRNRGGRETGMRTSRLRGRDKGRARKELTLLISRTLSPPWPPREWAEWRDKGEIKGGSPVSSGGWVMSFGLAGVMWRQRALIYCWMFCNLRIFYSHFQYTNSDRPGHSQRRKNSSSKIFPHRTERSCYTQRETSIITVLTICFKSFSIFEEKEVSDSLHFTCSLPFSDRRESRRNWESQIILLDCLTGERTCKTRRVRPRITLVIGKLRVTHIHLSQLQGILSISSVASRLGSLSVVR